MSNSVPSVDFDELNQLLDELGKEIRSFKFNSALISVSQLLTAVPGMRSSLKNFKNTVLSVQEGLESQEVSQKAALKDLVDAWELLRQQFHENLTKDSKPTDFDEELYSKLGRETLRVYDSSMDQIQKSITKSGIFTGYVPILPLTSPPFDAGKLKRSGVLAESYAGYTILRKQFVAGISHDYMHAYDPKRNDPEAPKKRIPKDEINEKLVQEFREIIQKRYANLKLIEVADPISWWGAVWLWMASPQEVKVWRSSTISSTTVASVKVKKWSFPFARG